MFTLDARPATILATVTQGYNPVIGADVYAMLESPDPGVAPMTLILRDVGAVADIVKDDGTYSAFIFDVAQRGRHTITVHADGKEGQTKLKTYVGSSKAAQKRSKFISIQNCLTIAAHKKWSITQYTMYI